MSGFDRRSECRYYADGHCNIRFKDGAKVVDLPGWLSDLSMRGFQITTSGQVPEKTVVMVTLESAPSHPLYATAVHRRKEDAGIERLGFRVLDGTLPYQVFQTLLGAARVAETPNRTPECFRKLGVRFPATAEEIHAAFRQQAKTAHPDHGGTDRAFVELYSAYKQAMELCAQPC